MPAAPAAAHPGHGSHRLRARPLRPTESPPTLAAGGSLAYYFVPPRRGRLVIEAAGEGSLEVMASTLASEDYVKSHARQCPHCNAPIEKNDGCNKVSVIECEIIMLIEISG